MSVLRAPAKTEERAAMNMAVILATVLRSLQENTAIEVTNEIALEPKVRFTSLLPKNNKFVVLFRLS